MIENERDEFDMLIEMMLQRVTTLKLLLTSTRLLISQSVFKEDVILLHGLSQAESYNLFKEVVARTIDQYEIN